MAQTTFTNVFIKAVTSIPDANPNLGKLPFSGAVIMNFILTNNLLVLYFPVDLETDTGNISTATKARFKYIDPAKLGEEDGLRLVDVDTGDVVPGTWTYESVGNDIFDELKTNGYILLYFNPTSNLDQNKQYQMRLEKYVDFLTFDNF